MEDVSNKESNDKIKIWILGYVISLILLILINTGPYLYFKLFKNKKITKANIIDSRTIG